jgi:predicted DNA-binding transcriptional regulator AlpA
MDSDIIRASEMKNIFPDTSDQYWATLRHKGGGPEYVKVGPRKVYYRRADIEAWIEGNRFTRTDRPVGARAS